MRAFERKLDLKRRLSVTFIGEPGVDDGGLSREYLRLLMKAVSDCSLLAGPPTRRIPQHNTFALQKGYFRVMGEMIVMSLCNGGPGPMCFSPVVVDYLFGGIHNVTPTIEDMPNISDVQDVLKKVCIVLGLFSYHTVKN